MSGKKKKPASKREELPKVHPKLKGFNIWINEQGEIESTYSVEEINKFLDDEVTDKKLKDRKDLKKKTDTTEENQQEESRE